MKADIKLFINGMEVEFSKDPQILYNYKLTDITNPTVTKNSYSKSITIEGTNQNNEIFGQIWNLERIQTSGSFNPIKKTDFVIYSNGSIYEKGYCKLDNVTMKNNTLEYTISLYGGLGSFFYNLTYGGNEDTNKKMTLADLKYVTYAGDREPDLDFRINKEAISEAWQSLRNNTFNNKWSVINFAPCYNGIPSDFDADTALINTNNTSEFTKIKTEDDTVYTTINGYLTGEASSDLTADETFDYRSYLMRPVVNMRRIIEACTRPENNGGWEVQLDPHFFNYDNPYWGNAWMTLPMLRDLKIEGGEKTTITNYSLTHNTTYERFYDVNIPTTTISNFDNIDMTMRVRFNQRTGTPQSELYTYNQYLSNTNFTLQDRFVKEYDAAGGIMVQLLGFDSEDNIVAQSRAYFLGNTEKNIGTGNSLSSSFYESTKQPDIMPYETDIRLGKWKQVTGNVYSFVNNATGGELAIRFQFNNNASVSKLRLKVKYPYQEYFKMTNVRKPQDTDMIYNYFDNHTYVPFYRQNSLVTTGNRGKETVRDMYKVEGDFSFIIDDFEAQVSDIPDLFSNTEITKDKLLTTEYTPCDYLLSYCKLFGLYFYINPDEKSDYEDCPSGVVHICDRHTFYDRNKVTNLEDLIDTQKTIKIVQQVPAAKWYEFSVEQIESDAENSYKDTYGFEYGRHLVNTGYNFDSNTKQLYDGSVFKSGIMVKEKDKYFNKPSGTGVYSYVRNGFTYHLFHLNSSGEYESIDIDFPTTQIPNNTISSDNKRNMDAYSKLQCHKEDNEAIDGDHILLFYNGVVNTNCTYYLTDDLPEMVSLNDSTPCWIHTYNEYDTNNRRIGIATNNIPFFSRNIQTSPDNGNIIHTWDFGHPMATYNGALNTDSMTIYERCWKNFINDVYNENSRTISCYVRLEDTPSTELMKHFYWFNNSFWRLNSIKDWNVNSLDTTLCEFIKVQDLSNYDVNRIYYGGDFYVILNTNTIGYAGGSLGGTIFKQDGGRWWVAETFSATDGTNTYTWPSEDYIHPQTGSGAQTSITIDVPYNNKGVPLTYTLGFIDGNDNWIHCYWTQTPEDTSISLNPKTLILDYDVNMEKSIAITSNIKNYNIEINE